MNADEIPIGSGFLGTVDKGVFYEHKKPGKPFPGELIRVTWIKPEANRGSSSLRNLHRLFTHHLPSDSDVQISSNHCMWVTGVRETRSKRVHLIEWGSPSSRSLLEGLHAATPEERQQTLDRLANQSLPFL